MNQGGTADCIFVLDRISVRDFLFIGGKFMLLGDLIEQQFTVVGDWNFGSAISIFMMIIILISMAVMSRFEDESDKEGGGLLF